MTLPPALTPSPDLSNRTVAYFSMEIALSPSLPTYSGGLGIDRKSTRLNSSHPSKSRMPSSA